MNCRGCQKRFPRLIFYETRIYVMQTGGIDMSKETANGYYTVYTRQSKKVLEELENTGVYRVKEEYIRMKNDSISEYYLRLYRWFAERCRERIDVPQGCSFPIWLSMHDEYRLRNTEDTVCLTLRIPGEKVYVISEYAWGFRVNYMYVPFNLEDERAFNEELKRYGIENEMALVTEAFGNYYPMLKKRIIASWDRVFELEPNSPSDELGVCFEIQREWIQNIESLT